MLILVPDHETDGRTRGGSFKNTRKQLHPVGFLPGGGDMGLSGLPAIQILLNKLYVNGHPGRTSVDDPANGSSVRLSERGESEYSSKTVQCVIFLIRLKIFNFSVISASCHPD